MSGTAPAHPRGSGGRRGGPPDAGRLNGNRWCASRIAQSLLKILRRKSGLRECSAMTPEWLEECLPGCLWSKG